MKRSIKIPLSSLILSGIILLSSCVSTTMIQSNPSGAKVYLNSETVGKTPYTHTDTKIVGSTTSLRIEKEGYETVNTSFSRNEQADVGAIIAGVFVLVPFLWTMKYKPTHTYELVPLNNTQSTVVPGGEQDTKSKTDRIAMLKQLLDDKIISQEEYEKAKKIILE